MSVNFNLLHYGSVLMTATELAPHFKCPVCNAYLFDKTITIAPSPTIDFNAQLAFLIPNHIISGSQCAGSGQQITLFVAIHKDATHSLLNRISIAAIPADWWTVAQKN